MSTSSSNNKDTTTTTTTTSVDDLAALLAALAGGAKAVNNLPLADDFEYEKSFPEFAQLYGESRHVLLSILNDLDLLDNNHDHDDDDNDNDELVEDTTAPSLELDHYDMEDPLIWEKCADACDLWMERVEGYLATSSSSSASGQKLQQLSEKTHQAAKGKLQTMVKALVEMEKPQDTLGIQPENDRTVPFVPKLHPHAVAVTVEQQEGHGLDTRFGSFRNVSISPHVIAPSTHALHPYQKTIESFSYQKSQLEVVDNSTLKKMKQKEEDASCMENATWIDTESELAKLVKRLQDEHVHQVAIDLEAHSYRSFSGFICLMQLSFYAGGEIQDYLIDTLALWHSMNQHMAPLFADPTIVKIMHGADSDVQWLQRDFSIYIVNLFDTGRAARLLKLSSAGYAYALSKYKNVTADKTHQLSDWRQRPLPSAMKVYATMDTHYLLDIYECMKAELYNHPEKEISIEAVLDISRQVCLVRYDKEAFNPQGYKVVMASSKRRQRTKRPTAKTTKSDLLPHQEQTLANLWDWRDRTARQQDESTQYVCPNPSLLRLALALPTSVTTLQSCLNPMPPLVLHHAQDVLECITTKHDKVASTPAGEGGKGTDAARGMLSPVMGTEALYKEAGWMTPSSQSKRTQGLLEEAEEIADDDDEMAGVTTTTTDGDDADYDPTHTKPKRLLMVDSANKDFRSAQYTGHSLEMGSNKTATVHSKQSQDKRGEEASSSTATGKDTTSPRGRVVDGLGSARAAMQTFVNKKGGRKEDAEQGGYTDEPSLREESEQAQQVAKDIRTTMSKKDNLMSMMPAQQIEDDKAMQDAIGGSNNKQKNDDDDDDNDVENKEDFEIPKSMREIYKISNQNRRKNKKAILSPSRQTSGGSTDGEDGIGDITANADSGNVIMQDKEDRMDVDTLEGAEAALASRGYFTTDAKRQRTKSEPSADSIEGGNNTASANKAAGKEDDIAFMQEIGWIKNTEDAQAMIQKQETQQQQDEGDQQGKEGAAVKTKIKTEKSSTGAPGASYDYSNVSAMGVYNPNAPAAANPFFSGAALTGGALAQGGGTKHSSGKGGPKKTTSARDKSARFNKQERPEKKEGRTMVYKKK